MGTLEEKGADAVAAAEKENLEGYARALSPDAQTVLRLLPYGGMVRARLQVELEHNPANEAPSATSGPEFAAWVMSPPTQEEVDALIEPLTVDREQLRSFFRASGRTRYDSIVVVTASLGELLLRGLVRTYQDDEETPRYALTVEGSKVAACLA